MTLQTAFNTNVAWHQNPLTERELEILLMMADGLNNKEIARALGLSEDTIDTHSRRLCAKLDARNAKQAIATAFRKRLIV